MAHDAPHFVNVGEGIEVFKIMEIVCPSRCKAVAIIFSLYVAQQAGEPEGGSEFGVEFRAEEIFEIRFRYKGAVCAPEEVINHALATSEARGQGSW